MTKKRLNAEWIAYMKAYRLYNPKNPQKTVAYEDSIKDAKKNSLENGYDEIIICNAD